MTEPHLAITTANCHDGCWVIVVPDGKTVEFNVSPLTGWKYIECNVCQTYPVAHTIPNHDGSLDMIHPTIEDAILHAWSHAS